MMQSQTNQLFLFGIISILALLMLLQTQTTLTGQQINEEILFPDFEYVLTAEEQKLFEEPEQPVQEQQKTLPEPVVQAYPEIPRPKADPECLNKCYTGFSLCLHRAEGDDKKTRKCYGSQEGCYLKCKEIA
ncbi:hypothetical protein HY484_00860 [Candidatus Woesearchaeota archaeon]|nr:hypothetical protein [Candidatus Woesearchaeota archaeon]